MSPLSSVQGSRSSPYDSGYDHGCDDADISDPSERYINQLEKGPSYHTDAFNNGYDAGFEACSGSSDATEDEDSSMSVNENIIDRFCQKLNYGDYAAAESIASATPLSAYALAIKSGCAAIGFLEWLTQ